jgi:hypothetical protein
MGKRGFTHFKRAKAAGSGSEAALEDEGIELEDLRAREVALQTERNILFSPFKSVSTFNMQLTGDRQRLAQALYEGNYQSSLTTLRDENSEFVLLFAIYHRGAALSDKWVRDFMSEAREWRPPSMVIFIDGIAIAVFDNLSMKIDYSAYSSGGQTGHMLEMTNWLSTGIPRALAPTLEARRIYACASHSWGWRRGGIVCLACLPAALSCRAARPLADPPMYRPLSGRYGSGF